MNKLFAYRGITDLLLAAGCNVNQANAIGRLICIVIMAVKSNYIFMIRATYTRLKKLH